MIRESAQAALTLVKAHAGALRIGPELFRRNAIHVHVPAAAIAQHGPSAGVAMLVALASLMTGRPVRNQKNLEDMPQETRRQLQCIWRATVDEALAEPEQHTV